ncbi:MAG: hypothetical protein C4567_17470 [Deltaproteobacteria bacterium]|nr:MAG: hypothetical protein C4567_17470 [Deltaproteobacteria bacterium]
MAMLEAKANPSTRGRALLLLALFALGLACLVMPAAAESGVATAWIRTYNGPANGWNEATAMVLDSQGNICVTGFSQRRGKDFYCDYLTVKFSPKGKRLWLRRYHGPLTNWNKGSSTAYAIAVDGQDNVYVTGSSTGGDYGGDCATIKYSPDGKELWVQRYRNVSPIAVAVDHQNNAYVAGEDYTTIKYSPDGRQLWVKKYNIDENYPWDNGNKAMALDAQGNVYVTGSAGGPGVRTGYLTVKYSSDGEELWLRRYSAGPGVDWARAIALDGQGNVYITGESVTRYYEKTNYRDSTYLTIKYDANGQLLWAQHFGGDAGTNLNNAMALALDEHGYVHVTGQFGYYGSEYQTIKYTPDGQLLWVSRHLGGYDGANAIAVDTLGGVYVSGSLVGNFTIKYNPEGQEIWTRRYRGPRNSWDRASAIAVDPQGNVYVIGDSDGPGYSRDYVTIKYIQTPRTGR